MTKFSIKKLTKGFKTFFILGDYSNIVLILSLLIITIILSVWGGYPFSHPDEGYAITFNIIRNNGDPHHFHRPGGALYYLNAIILAILTPISNILFKFDEKFILMITSHTITYFFSCLGVVFTFLLIQKITKNKFISYFSALMLSTSLVWIKNSHFYTVDIPLSSLIVLTHYTLLWSYKCIEKVKSQLTIGIFAGLTFSMKYTGILIFLPIFFVIFLRGISLKLKLLSVFRLLICSCSIFFLTNPFFIINYEKSFNDLLFEIRHSQIGHFGFESENVFLYHLGIIFPSWSLFLICLSIIGIVIIVFWKKITIENKIILIAFFTSYSIVTFNSKLSFERNLLPLIPFVVVYISIAVYFLIYMFKNISHKELSEKSKKLLKNKSSTQIVYILIFILYSVSLFFNSYETSYHNWLLNEKDSRQLLREELDIYNSSTNFNFYCGKFMVNHLIQADIDPNRIYTENNDVYYKLTNDQYITYRISNFKEVDVYIFDSISHDPYIFDELALQKLVFDINESSLICFKIDIYVNETKKGMPYTPESIYSPSKPDLLYRIRQGPYIEIYVKNDSYQRPLINFLQNSQIIRPCEETYYLNALSEK